METGKLIALPVREQIGRFKYTPAEEVESRYQAVLTQLEEELKEAKAAKEDL